MAKNKKSLIHVFLSEEAKPHNPFKVNNPPLGFVPDTSKTDKNIDNLKKRVDDKKISDVNKELDNYESILEGPFDDAYGQHEKGIEDKVSAAKKEKNKKNLTKLDAPFSNNLKECGFDMDTPEHEAMETPEEEAQEHMPGGSEYGLEEPEDYITITIGHSADEKMSKTGMPAFNVGGRNSFGAPGGPNFKDGIDDELNEELDETKKTSSEKKSTWQPPKKGVNPFPKKGDNKKIDENFGPGEEEDQIQPNKLDDMWDDPRQEYSREEEYEKLVDQDDDWNSLEGHNKERDMFQESFNPKRWQKLAGMLKECPMDPFNEFSDDPEFDEDGIPIEKHGNKRKIENIN